MINSVRMNPELEMREATAMFQRIIHGFADLIIPKRSRPKAAPTKPGVEFSHSRNAELFALLRRWWFESATRPDADRLWVHPDLIERFRNLAPIGDVKQGTVYLRAVAANSQGLIFAWATGTHAVFLRLPPELKQRAIEEGGRFDPTYGPDWIEFNAWSQRWGQNSKWDEALKRWTKIAYEESLKLTPDS